MIIKRWWLISKEMTWPGTVCLFWMRIGLVIQLISGSYSADNRVNEVYTKFECCFSFGKILLYKTRAIIITRYICISFNPLQNVSTCLILPTAHSSRMMQVLLSLFYTGKKWVFDKVCLLITAQRGRGWFYTEIMKSWLLVCCPFSYSQRHGGTDVVVEIMSLMCRLGRLKVRKGNWY